MISLASPVPSAHICTRRRLPCACLSVALGSPQAEITESSPHLKGRCGILVGRLQIKQKQDLVEGAEEVISQ